VFGEYLYQLPPHPGFPATEEEEEAFGRFVVSEETCVDQLLERIFSSAQNLAIGLGEMLFPIENIEGATVKPNQEQIQQVMFQCVSCAALLIVCYVAGKWVIPEDKVRLIIGTILRTTPARFVTTQTIMANVEAILGGLVSSKVT
jgi:hypothetical protein